MADISITSSLVVPSANARVTLRKAKVAVTAGQAVAENSDAETVLYDADVDTLRYIGLAGCSASAGQYFAVIDSDPDLAIGGTVSAGTVYFASATAGGICPAADLSAGNQVVALGVAKAGNKFNLSPSRNVIRGEIPTV